MFLIVGILLAVLFQALEAGAQTTNTRAVPTSLPLSEALTPLSVAQAYGSLGFDRSVDGRALRICANDFADGLGTHANSRIVYDLGGRFTRFESWVGVDAEMANHRDASVVFQIFGDGRKLFDSGAMRVDTPAKFASVDVGGVKEMALVVTDAGDGISCDHADWGQPRLIGVDVMPAEEPAVHEVKSGRFRVGLNKDGGLAGMEIDGRQYPLSGFTRFDGCTLQGATAVSGNEGAFSFTRTLMDAAGHSAIVVDSFAAEPGGIRWDVQITSSNAPWSTAVSTCLRQADATNALFWTAWGAPDISASKALSPELTALIQQGRAAVRGDWMDPLVPAGFATRTWHYGNAAGAIPTGSDYISVPLFTVLMPGTDAGLSLVLSPEDVLLDVDLAVTARGQARFIRTKNRLGVGKTVRFRAHLVPHEASWRGGLRFMAAHYPAFFDPPNPRAHQLAACGAYSTGEEEIDVAKFKKMAFGFNWKLSDDFPYMGMFIPPVKDADEQWERSCAEGSAAYKGRYSSCRAMNDYARYMKTNGFAVLSYFNVTEFGKNINPRPADIPPGRADAPDLWKDCTAYFKTKLPDAWLKIDATDNPGWSAVPLAGGVKGVMGNCYGGLVVDPGDPGYKAFLLEQAKRHIDLLPDTDGLCIDRLDWLRFYNATADDGVSWHRGRPARSLYRSFAALMAEMGLLLHHADKVVFANLMTMRLEMARELDGIYTEFGNAGPALNGSALMGLRKPVVCWSYAGSNDSMQWHLYMGCFPTAPFPHNNHCINPSPYNDRLYMDYGPLLDAMRGKKWVLAPRAVVCETGKVNLFEVPGGYALPVVFGGGAASAEVTVRNVPDLAKLNASALHPGDEKPVAVSSSFSDGRLVLDVPLARGCAMVLLKR